MKKYTINEIHEIIKEFTQNRTDLKQDESNILEAALFIEDVFGLVLHDDEIHPGNLGTEQSMKDFVFQKLDIG